MKIVITGATGNIGQELVTYLNKQGHQLLLTGRDKNTLEKRFSNIIGKNIKCVTHDTWHQHAKGYDALVHLATRNNDHKTNLDESRKANITYLQDMVKGMRNVGIIKIIYFTSIHACDISKSDAYSVTKREAEAWLCSQDQLEIIKFRLPAILTKHTQGNLRYINHLPDFLQPFGLNISKCLRPAADMNTIIVAMENALEKKFFNKSEILVSDRQMNNPIYNTIAKLMDYGVGILVLLVLAWWLMVIIWLAIRLTSKGPGIFAQERVGKNRKVFQCYKFRTMQVGTVQAGTHQVSASSVTSVGKFLRKTHLDELPQFVNLLKNEMSLVGPRPCLPNQDELIEARDKQGVFSVKPGITGLAQVRNIDMSDPDKLANVDAYYLDIRTTIMDILLLLATVFGRFRKYFSQDRNPVFKCRSSDLI